MRDFQQERSGEEGEGDEGARVLQNREVMVTAKEGDREREKGLDSVSTINYYIINFGR